MLSKNDSKYIVHGSKNGLFKYDLLTLEHYLSKPVRRFDPSTTGLDHVLVSRVLPQISAGWCAMNNIFTISYVLRQIPIYYNIILWVNVWFSLLFLRKVRFICTCYAIMTGIIFKMSPTIIVCWNKSCITIMLMAIRAYLGTWYLTLTCFRLRRHLLLSRWLL